MWLDNPALGVQTENVAVQESFVETAYYYVDDMYIVLRMSVVC